jgi:hypothetical protein
VDTEDAIARHSPNGRPGKSGEQAVVFPEYSLHGLSMDTNPANSRVA